MTESKAKEKLNRLSGKVGKVVSKYEKSVATAQARLDLMRATLNRLSALNDQLQGIPDGSVDLGACQIEFDSIKKDAKMRAKELKAREKQARRLAKLEAKQIKEVKAGKLASARILELPVDNDLTIIVDGWNIAGCDSEGQMMMRRRRKGDCIRRLVDLMNQFAATLVGEHPNNQYQIWFDGKGKLSQHGRVRVEFSGTRESVDDKLVRELSDRKTQGGNQIVVVTSDKGLTLRLNEIQVPVMKSGHFYKLYWRQFVKKYGESSEESESSSENDMEEDGKTTEDGPGQPGSNGMELDDGDSPMKESAPSSSSTKTGDSKAAKREMKRKQREERKLAKMRRKEEKFAQKMAKKEERERRKREKIAKKQARMDAKATKKKRTMDVDGDTQMGDDGDLPPPPISSNAGMNSNEFGCDEIGSSGDECNFGKRKTPMGPGSPGWDDGDENEDEREDSLCFFDDDDE